LHWSDQFYLDPIVDIPAVVAKQRGDFIHVVDDNIYVAIIVVISEGATAARVPRRDPGPISFDTSWNFPFPRLR